MKIPKLIYAVLFVFLGSLIPQTVQALTPDEALVVLGDKKSSFEDKKEAFEAVATSSVSWSQLLLDAATDGNLYYSKKSGALFAEVNGTYFEVKSGTAFNGKKRELKRVAVNNSIRESLNLLSAMRTLADKSLPEEERIESARALVGRVSQEDATKLQLLRDLYIKSAPELSEMIDYVIASADLNDADPKIRNEIGRAHV